MTASVPFVRLVYRTFAFLLWIAFPLAHDAIAVVAGASFDAAILLPKLLVLCTAMAAGVVALLVSRPAASRSRPTMDVEALRSSAGSPWTLRLWTALAVWIVIATTVQGGWGAALVLGTADRMDGPVVQLMTIGIVALTYALVRSNVLGAREHGMWFLAGAAVVAAWVVAESLTYEPLALLGLDMIATSADATFGHRAWASTYLAMALAYHVAQVPRKRARIDPRPYLLTALLSAAVFGSGGRAGLIAGLLVTSIVVIARMLRRPTRLHAVTTVFAVCIGASTIIGLSDYASTRSLTVRHWLNGTDGSFNDRVDRLWPIGLEGLGDVPLWGLGPMGYQRTFYATIDREELRRNVASTFRLEPSGLTLSNGPLFRYEHPDTGAVTFGTYVVDRAHNYLIDFAYFYGVVASVILVCIGLSYVLHRSPDGRFALNMRQEWLAPLVVFALYSMVWFVVLPLDPIAYAVAGIAAASQRPSAAARERFDPVG